MTLSIKGRKIGAGYPPYIIAELSANHNGNIQRALETIKAASDSGADAVKIQTYTADTMTIDCDAEDFMIRGGLWDGFKLYDLYKKAETPFHWHRVIFDYASSIGMTIFSTPFDESAVDLLESLRVPAYKVASFEATDIPLIKYIASKRKPIILSTGMCSELEIQEAVDVIRSEGVSDIVLLHCISSYPAPINCANMLQMQNIAKRFNCYTGLSDHTLGNTASLVAVSLGASVIEKHFTLRRSDGGADSEFSIEPNELKSLCSDSFDAWSALGRASFDRDEVENPSKQFRRSIYFVKDIKAGEVISDEHIRRIRPGYGIPPKYFNQLIGKRVLVDVKRGTAATWSLINE